MRGDVGPEVVTGVSIATDWFAAAPGFMWVAFVVLSAMAMVAIVVTGRYPLLRADAREG